VSIIIIDPTSLHQISRRFHLVHELHKLVEDFSYLLTLLQRQSLVFLVVGGVRWQCLFDWVTNPQYGVQNSCTIRSCIIFVAGRDIRDVAHALGDGFFTTQCSPTCKISTNRQFWAARDGRTL